MCSLDESTKRKVKHLFFYNVGFGTKESLKCKCKYMNENCAAMCTYHTLSNKSMAKGCGGDRPGGSILNSSSALQRGDLIKDDRQEADGGMQHMKAERDREVSHRRGSVSDGWQHPREFYLYASISVQWPQGVSPAFLLMRE